MPGPITHGEAFAVQPFSNIVTTLTLTGAQIDTVLEQQFSINTGSNAGQPRTPDPTVLLPSTGFTYTWNAAAPLGARVDPTTIKLNNVTIDPVATYRVVVNNFLATGGDDFPIFDQGTNRVTGADDLVALEAYLAAHDPYTPVDLTTAVPDHAVELAAAPATLREGRPDGPALAVPRRTAAAIRSVVAVDRTSCRSRSPRSSLVSSGDARGRRFPRGLDQCQAVERERRHGQRLHGQADEEQRRVIGRRSVGVQHATAGAAVDDHPLALAADGDRDRLHAGTAVVEHGAVARPIVDVTRPQARRAVVAMLRARCIGGHVEPALDAAERHRL